MQDIKIKEVQTKEGKTSGKEYFIVIDDKGGKYTAFDPAIKTIASGSVISAEIKVEGKYINLEKWELKEKPPEAKVQASPPQGNGKQFYYGKSNEQLLAERHSIESQTAYNGVIELIKANIDIPPRLKMAAFEWAYFKITGNKLIEVKKPPEEIKTEEKPPLSPDQKHMIVELLKTKGFDYSVKETKDKIDKKVNSLFKVADVDHLDTEQAEKFVTLIKAGK